jgi:hypothetical protein
MGDLLLFAFVLSDAFTLVSENLYSKKESVTRP